MTLTNLSFYKLPTSLSFYKLPTSPRIKKGGKKIEQKLDREKGLVKLQYIQDWKQAKVQIHVKPETFTACGIMIMQCDVPIGEFGIELT